MRVVAVMGMAGRIKPPGAIVAGDAMSQILPGQPLQHAINGHAIHAMTVVNPLFDFLVGQRTIGRE